jgi:hypothetical protein
MLVVAFQISPTPKTVIHFLSFFIRQLTETYEIMVNVTSPDWIS